MNVNLNDRLTLTIKEALAVTGISRSKFYDEMGAGRIKTIKVGRRVLITVDALRAWMSALEVA